MEIKQRLYVLHLWVICYFKYLPERMPRITEMSTYITIRLAVLECSFSNSFNLIWRWLCKKNENITDLWKANNHFKINLEYWCKVQKFVHVGKNARYLGFIQLNFVVCDSPRFIFFHFVCNILLFIIFMKSEWFNHFFKGCNAESYLITELQCINSQF